MTAAAGRSARRKLTPAWALFLVVAVAAVVGLGSLGTWQVQRLGWKRTLIAASSTRVQLAPVPAPAAGQWAGIVERPDDFIYRRVELSGHWQTGLDTWVQATTELGAGYWLITPLARDDGTVVLINRGFVARREPAPSAALVDADGKPNPVTVTGLLRTSESPGVFPRRNDPDADRWFSRDVAAIADRRGLGPVAPYFVDAQAATSTTSTTMTPHSQPQPQPQPQPEASTSAEPVPGLTVVQFRNHHLGYAVTWFVLAAMTAGAAWRVWRWHCQGIDGDEAAGTGGGGEAGAGADSSG